MGALSENTYNEGYHAFLNDVSLVANPYQYGDERAYQWELGWKNGAKEARDAKNDYTPPYPTNIAPASHTKTEKAVDNSTHFTSNPDSGNAVAIIELMYFVVGCFFLFILYLAGNAAFGGFFKASNGIEKETTKAQTNLHNALFYQLSDYGKFEVKFDYSVYAYIDRINYENIPYPDRATAMSEIASRWCKDEKINRAFLPKVVLKDIRTGETIASKRCILL